MSQSARTGRITDELRSRGGAARRCAARALGTGRARLAVAVGAALACSLYGTGLPMSRAQPVRPTASATPAAPAAAAAANPAAGQPGQAVGQAVGQAALDDAHHAMAEKFATAAMDLLHRGVPGEHQWQEGGALLKAACTLNPAEPSYPRLLAETWRQLGDNKQVLAALIDYRRAAKDAHWTEDQVVQVEMIDRYLVEMETDDERLKYLQDVVSKPTLSPEVQAHAAVLAVPILAQRSGIQAGAMLQQAIRLDPFNVRARRMQYQSIAATGTPLERIQVLLKMVLCNPAQRDVMIEFARQLSEEGLADLSLDWYRGAILLSKQIGAPFDNQLELEFVTQLYVAGQIPDASFNVDQVLEASPRNPDAWFMRLAFDRSDPERVSAYQQELEVAKQVFVAQAAAVAKKVLGPPKVLGEAPAEPPDAAATRPAGPAAAADVSRDALNVVVDRIKQGKGAQGMGGVFLTAAADLAWFHLYFEEAPDEAVRWVEVVKALLPPDDPRVLRLQGWLDLGANRTSQAWAELSSIKDVDPLACVGVIRMTARGQVPRAGAAPATAAAPATGPAASARAPPSLPAPNTGPAGTAPPLTRPTVGLAAAAPSSAPTSAPTAPTAQALSIEEERNFRQADALAKQLIGRHHVGLTGAIISAAYRGRKIQQDPRPEAAAIRQEVSRKFPQDWVRIIEDPKPFYYIVAKPVVLTRPLGDPLTAWVQISNKSNFGLTIGPEGIISPDLFFDARLGLMGDQTFPMAAYDRIANVLVLPPHSQTTQIVRVDQGSIAEALRKTPDRDVTLYCRVTTNPIPRRDTIVPGPAGERVDFNQQFVRTTSVMFLPADKQKVLNGLSAQPSRAMLTLDALSAHVEAARDPNAGDGSPQLKGKILALAPELVTEIDKTRNDPVPEVAAWATYQLAKLAPANDKPALVESLRASHNWEVRLLGGVAATMLSPEQCRPIAAQLANDAEPVVQAFGTALRDDLARPTSRPSAVRSAPTTAPGDATGAATKPITIPIP